MLMTDVGVETFRCEFEISVSPTFRRQHQVVINITLAVSIHDTVSRLKKKNKNFDKEIQIDTSKTLFDWPRVAVNQFGASI